MTSPSADDYIAIQQLVHRYADAVIHRDGVAWGATWAVDAVWTLTGGRHVVGREAIVELWNSSMGRYSAVCQVVHSGEVHMDSPDTAHGRFYIREWYQRVTGEAGILVAHYDDTYVRTAEGWRFSGRQLQAHYQGPADLSGSFLSTREALEKRGLSTTV